ncbi:MAG: hypothetical protein BAJALOKI1v1_880006 [Promethearchaeota archaeon]|nr:MAG: hypothetical protein BAJALOKI1v1_880006 [Candidatus Lokiarchaeota archaeon]
MKHKKVNFIVFFIGALSLIGLIGVVSIQDNSPVVNYGLLNNNFTATPEVSVEFEQDLSISKYNVSFIGEGNYNESGRCVASAGDVNGDGYDDILIGAQNYSAGKGKVYLIFGRNNANWSVDMNLANANASFLGEFDGDQAGVSLASAGDVNNDNYDDFLIGAPSYNRSKGKTYLFFGRSSGWSLDMNISSANASFIGEDQFDRSGRSIAGAGDINNDSYDDIIIGANTPSGVGEIYLLFGNESQHFSVNMSLSDANASFIGEENQDQAGASVAGAGDINNDGFSDIIIGAPYYDGSSTNIGKTYIFFGNDSESDWTIDMSLSNANASFLGESEEDYLGFSVAGAGDVNNDNYDDIIMSAYGYDASAGNEGKIYLIFGNNSESDWEKNMNIGISDASFVGEYQVDEVGIIISTAGDVNNDGYADFLIGSESYENGDLTGKAYLIFGNESNHFTNNFNLSNADASYIGENFDDRSGFSVAGGGDVNNDGCDDFLIGAFQNDDGGTNAGKSYLLFGNIAPQFVLRPVDISFVNGTTGHNIAWRISDNETNNPSYTIYNGTTPITNHIGQTWISGDDITLNVDNFTVGEYTVKIVVWDGMGGTNEDEVNITVTAPSSPPPSNLIIGLPEEPVEIPGFSSCVLLLITLFSIISTLFILRRKGKLLNLV